MGPQISYELSIINLKKSEVVRAHWHMFFDRYLNYNHSNRIYSALLKDTISSRINSMEKQKLDIFLLLDHTRKTAVIKKLILPHMEVEARHNFIF